MGCRDVSAENMRLWGNAPGVNMMSAPGINVI